MMKAIKEARQELGWSMKKLSDEFQIPYRTLQDWEAGRSNPPKYVEILVIEKLERLKNEEEGK